MDSFIKLLPGERAEIFTAAATNRDLPPEIIEKDFWVCWTLKKLFEIKEIGPHLTFKGGTSLSKVYDLIQRFSEDIDLTIERAFLGIDEESVPSAKGNERGRRLEGLENAAQKKIEQEIKPLLESCFRAFLPPKDKELWSLEVDTDPRHPQTILFHYPKVLSYQEGFLLTEEGGFLLSEDGGKILLEETSYITPVIRLEFGAKGDISPQGQYTVTSYVAEEFPKEFSDATAKVTVLEAERTFWEKATILHALHNSGKLRPRLSRHYYDLVMMARSAVAEKAMAQPTLLEAVVRNKSAYFKDAAASYDTAKIGTLRLVPKDSMLVELKRDYEAMQDMLYGASPSFNEIMASLADIEAKVNGKNA